MALPGCPEPGWVSPRLWTLLAVGPVAERRNAGVPAGLTLVSPTLLSGLTSLSQGWPWQTQLKPEPLQHCDCMAHTVRSSEKDLLNCSRL